MLPIRRVRCLLISGCCLMLLFPVLATAQVAWVQSYDEALQLAAKEKKFVVLDISASW